MGKSWQKLHNFTYLIVILVAIHFYWSVKSEIIEPSIYIMLVVVLLGVRGNKIKRWLS
jgi:sulfoxide reductase heme-binding subunit YedZ